MDSSNTGFTVLHRQVSLSCESDFFEESNFLFVFRVIHILPKLTLMSNAIPRLKLRGKGYKNADKQQLLSS
jgi:hypothetical protein